MTSATTSQQTITGRDPWADAILLSEAESILRKTTPWETAYDPEAAKELEAGGKADWAGEIWNAAMGDVWEPILTARA